MASNYPQAPQKDNHTVIIAVMAIVIVVLVAVIGILVFQNHKDDHADDAAASEKSVSGKQRESGSMRDDPHLNELRENLDMLRSNMNAYLEGVPEYEAGLIRLEDGKLQLAEGQNMLDQGYANYNAEHQSAGNIDQHAIEPTDLQEFEAAERDLVRGLFALLQRTPEVVKLMQKDAYFGSSFDYNRYQSYYGDLDSETALGYALSDPLFFLWERDFNGNAIVLNGHPLLDLDACETVIDAAQEYRNTYTGEDSPWD